MSKQELKVPVASGKYTFVSPADDYRIHVLRYGEPWHGPQGEASNAILALMVELDAARLVLQAARAVARDPTCLREIYDAVKRHDQLVGDHEPPSSWCSSAPPEGRLEDPDDLTAQLAATLRARGLVVVQIVVQKDERGGYRFLGVKAERSDIP